jgi:(E)-4-hydroxy-3-methylbut-2-enyl-diphosphate synthase
MTNIPTKDVAKTVAQIHALEQAGCQIIRVAVLDSLDAEALKAIIPQIHIPLVADIHFDYRLALQSIEAGVAKLRINPGNIGSLDRIKLVVEACKKHNIPIRIGVNLGSLDRDIQFEYGRTALALVKSAEKHVEILEDLDFHNIIISLKASDVPTTIEAYQLASIEFNYPLHIGVTEAGTQFGGSIKSAVGLGILLQQGIGDTIRVSLTDDPVQEVVAAQEILASLGYLDKPTLVSCPTCGRTQYEMIPIAKEIEQFLQTLPKVPLKVAIMGCVVNGPGEAKDADIGVAGGREEALLFKKGIAIRKIPQDEIVKVLKEEILAWIKETVKS